MIEQITPAALARRRDAGEDWQLLDVREPWERRIVSLPGSIGVPMSEITRRHGELDRQSPVAVLCHGGIRSNLVAEYLRGVGFGRVANVAGGIDAWAVEVDPSLPRY